MRYFYILCYHQQSQVVFRWYSMKLCWDALAENRSNGLLIFPLHSSASLARVCTISSTLHINQNMKHNTAIVKKLHARRASFCHVVDVLHVFFSQIIIYSILVCHVMWLLSCINCVGMSMSNCELICRRQAMLLTWWTGRETWTETKWLFC